MLQHLLFLASPKQVELTKHALSRLGALKHEERSAVADTYRLKHRLLGSLTLQINLISHLDALTPHLRQHPVDLLIYDERSDDGIPAATALEHIRSDVRALASMWGPDFLFPMSRVVAILKKDDERAREAFILGRLNIRDVHINPKNTATLLRWLHDILMHGIKRKDTAGMAFAGGGIEGFLYQVGVIYALQNALKGRSLTNLDVYTGVSSGSIAASLLAGEVPTEEVIKALLGKSEELPPLTSGTLYDLASKDILKRILGETFTFSFPNPSEIAKRAMRGIPTGFFKGDKLKSYVKEALTKYRHEDSFQKLTNKLFIGATDQDSFEHVTFGKAPWDDVPISDAIRASCALPPFFTPSQIKGRWFIDGQVTRTCNLELVVESGCRLIFIIDPLKPHPALIPGTVDQQGGVYALIQTVKALVYTRFNSVLQHVAERYPDTDFMVFQPDEECAELMSGSPMKYRIRTQVIQLAFKGTLRKFRERHHVYSEKLKGYGFKLASPEELVEIENNAGRIFESPD